MSVTMRDLALLRLPKSAVRVFDASEACLLFLSLGSNFFGQLRLLVRRNCFLAADSVTLDRFRGVLLKEHIFPIDRGYSL